MAIRFDSAYNAEIRKVVRNFNQKRNRAIKRGFRNLPPPMSVSELKSRYTRRADLNRDLKLIRQFNQEDALEVVENSGGVTAINWEVKYLKANINRAKEFYDREIYELSQMDTDLGVTKREMINNLRSKRAYLDLELDTLAPDQYSTYKATINEYLRSNYNKKQAYRGWMNEVESIMKRLGYDNKTVSKFFEGFDQLSPAEFITLYRQSNLVSRIYELYIPSRQGKFKLSTTEDDAKELIDTFIEQKDQMIARAKSARKPKISDKEYDKFIKELNEERKNYKRPPLRNSREEVTKEDIEMIEALGGTIEDLLK